jgi:hypothetical protein
MGAITSAAHQKTAIIRPGFLNSFKVLFLLTATVLTNRCLHTRQHGPVYIETMRPVR